MNLFKKLCSALLPAALCIGSAIGANAPEPVSGLPLPPEFKKTGDPVQSYKYCGKEAHSVLYIAIGLDGLDAERAWYSKTMPGAKVFVAVGGVVTYISTDGTAAVELADAFVSYFRFSPGLTPDEMKILGAAPAARDCSAS
jgi:hypothetical protein